jgi:hypothetical protein
MVGIPAVDSSAIEARTGVGVFGGATANDAGSERVLMAITKRTKTKETPARVSWIWLVSLLAPSRPLNAVCSWPDVFGGKTRENSAVATTAKRRNPSWLKRVHFTPQKFLMPASRKNSH